MATVSKAQKQMRENCVLRTENLTRHFGGLRAVDGVDFALNRGELHGLIGPNGAGKTTFVSLLCGRIFPNKGAIYFNEKNITKMPPHRRVEKGIVYTFQITSVFKNFTIHDNVALPAQKRLQLDGKPLNTLNQQVLAILEEVSLQNYADKRAGTLSYGHQRILEIAMGIALKPQLLILDEPTQGLSESEIADFKKLIRKLSGDTTIMLIEHNMNVVMDLAEKITVLNFGQILAQDTTQNIKNNKAVQDAYLGRAK